ncbi:long-chain-fatty-acid--CoA ligase [Candidatus Sumerlaeota bacterium]|nr:long-chain-fatty-acid--CoA ligase [Candidatus Sumerlaeota bacterium]
MVSDMERPVNTRPLSPLNFLERSAHVFRDKRAILHGDKEWTYAEFAARIYRQASALAQLGIGKGDCVAIMAPNIPHHLETHFGVPLTGAILCSINIRLASKEVEYIINHCGAKVLFVDSEFAPVIQPIRENLKNLKTIVNIVDSDEGEPLQGGIDYEEFLARGSPEPIEIPVEDENDPITVNYTSGTTGNPKGVVYTHRGAYLNCLGNALEAGTSSWSKYLWIVPMFHCNGWCFTWGLTGVGATSVCLRKVDPAEIFRLIAKEKITHFCGAPTVLISLYSHPGAKDLKIDWTVKAFTGGAPPSPTVLREMEALNIEVTHLYGLTETYGPHTFCEWQEKFDAQGEEYRFRMKSRQGVASITAHEQRVVDEEMNDVAPDATQMGEVVMRGNNVMKEYYKDPEATAKAFRGGWFHSGDMGVMHADGYIELRDRSKDIIISGGENISSIEVENVLYRHPEVLEAAVIAIPHEKWGEVPMAFIVPKPGTDPTEESIIDFCRGEMAHFKCPKKVRFGELPKTSTGKIKKFVLREKEWAGMAKGIH